MLTLKILLLEIHSQEVIKEKKKILCKNIHSLII